MKLEAKRKRNRIQNSLQPTVRAKIRLENGKMRVYTTLSYLETFLSKTSLAKILRIDIYMRYPNGGSNSGSYTNRIDAKKALKAFLEK